MSVMIENRGRIESITEYGYRARRSVAWLVVGAFLLAHIPAMFGQNVQYLPAINPVAGNKTAGNSGNGGNALSASISATATAITYDSYGNLYIADSGNNVIRRVDAVTGTISVFAGGATTVCSAANTDVVGTVVIGDNCPATQAILNNPEDIRFYKGDLYIADTTDNYIRVVSGTTGIITAYAGTGKTSASTAGSNKLAIAFKQPQAIALDPSGNLFIAIAGGTPNVYRIDAVTKTLPSLPVLLPRVRLETVDLLTSAQLRNITGLATDAQGNVYIAETANFDVRKVTVSTGIITDYAGLAGTTATAGYSGDGGPATAATLKIFLYDHD